MRITQQVRGDQIEYNNLVKQHKQAMLKWKLCTGSIEQKNILCDRVNHLVHKIDAHPHYKILMQAEENKFGKREK